MKTNLTNLLYLARNVELFNIGSIQFFQQKVTRQLFLIAKLSYLISTHPENELPNWVTELVACMTLKRDNLADVNEFCISMR